MANSKVLLIDDVDELGRSGDIVSVRPGYARNFLLPKKLAVTASAHAVRMQARLQEERKKRAEEDKVESEKIAGSMEGLTVEAVVKVDQEGHMYGSVSAGDIVELIQAQNQLTLEKRFIQLKHPIKEVGVFEIPVKLKEGVMTKVTVKVTPEEPTSE